MKLGLARSKPEAEVSALDRVENFTDLGNARRLVRTNGADMRHCSEIGGFLIWNGQRWVRDDGEVMRRAKRAVMSMYAEAAEESDPDRRKAISGHAQRSESEKALKAMTKLAISEVGVSIAAAELDRDPFLLNVENGTVELRVGKLRAHRRTDYLSKLAPVTLDLAACCPRWLAFLEQVLPDSDVRGFVQRAIGYSLTGVTLEQVFFMLWGMGANGKSTFLETIKALLGDYALKTPADTLLARRDTGIPNDVARLMGARLVMAVEMEEGRRLAEVRVKELTGGDTISARFMRGEWFEFVPACKLWIGTNHKPAVRGTDEAVWRRIRLIPFNVTIPEPDRDRGLGEALRAELPGILNWAVDGCLAWQREGLNPPPGVVAATEAYRADEDTLAGFLDECCVTGPDCVAWAGELYAAYKAWCEKSGERPLSQRALSGQLRERGLQNHRRGHGGRRAWTGVGLREQDHDTGEIGGGVG